MSDQLNDTPDNLIPVNILIADRNYRVKISPKDEEAVQNGCLDQPKIGGVQEPICRQRYPGLYLDGPIVVHHRTATK